MPHALFSVLVLATILTTAEIFASPRDAPRPGLRMTILFNNMPYRPDLTAGWGFSCLIEGFAKTILFDTGSDGAVLLSNMNRLKASPRSVDAIVLSHSHADHTGGIAELLSENAEVDIFLPAGFPASFREGVAATGAKVHMIKEGAELLEHVYSTGELDHGLPEQALILDTPKGLVVITGCAHPGIGRIAEAAIRLTGKKIHLALGGFHLLGKSESEIDAVIGRLKTLGVEKVAPSHCTGEAATAQFREAWGKDFVEGGLGAVIEIALP